MQIAGTVSLVNTNHSSAARIGDGAVVNAANDIVVHAQTRNTGLQNKAESAVKARKEAGKDGESELAISATVAYGNYERSAEAYLGSGSKVQAQRLGISSEVLMPYMEVNEPVNWDNVKEFSNLSEELGKLKDLAGNPLLTSYANAAEVSAVAKDLNVSEREVLEMEARLSGRDIGFDAPDDADDDHAPPAPANYLVAHDADPASVYESADSEADQLDVLREGMAKLDARSRDIIKRRWLDADSKVTLQELADEYGVSAERIRQIEANALKKMKALFAA